MAEMDGKQPDGKQVKSGDNRNSESQYNHGKNIMIARLRLDQSIEVHRLSGKGLIAINLWKRQRVVQQVVDDEGGDHEARPNHRPRRQRGALRRNRSRITDRTRGPVRHRQADGGRNVEADHGQQSDPGRPQQFRRRLQKMAVRIDVGRWQEKLEIPSHVPEDKEQQGSAREGHDIFFAQGRPPDL